MTEAIAIIEPTESEDLEHQLYSSKMRQMYGLFILVGQKGHPIHGSQFMFFQFAQERVTFMGYSPWFMVQNDHNGVKSMGYK